MRSISCGENRAPMFACLRIIAMSPIRVDRHPLSGGSVLDSHLAALNTSWLPRLSTLSEAPEGVRLANILRGGTGFQLHVCYSCMIRFQSNEAPANTGRSRPDQFPVCRKPHVQATVESSVQPAVEDL